LKEKYIKKKHSPLWGVSTSNLLNKYDFEHLLEYEPEVIEFYNYKSIDPIVAFCSRHHIRPALHVPTPFDKGEFNRFFPTAPGTKEEIDSAIEMTRATIKCASEIEALHVIVHFPTPCPPFSPITNNDIDLFFKKVCDYAARLNVNLLVENMTPHPDFHTPQDYLRLTDNYNLYFCLDVGHAHLLEPRLGVQNFIEQWGPKTKSVHLYNMTKSRYSTYGHEPITEGQKKEDGWIDIEDTLNNIIRFSDPHAIILEYGSMTLEEIKKSANTWKNFKKKAIV